MEDKIKQALELLKQVAAEPTEENGVALFKATMDIEPFEAMAIVALALRIKTPEGRPFKSILLTTPAWIEWAYAYREYIDTADIKKNMERRNEIIQELGLEGLN